MRRALALLAVAALLSGCGSTGRGAGSGRQHRSGTGGSGGQQHSGATGGIPASLLAAVRPIGRGPRFTPGPGHGVTGACRARLGRRLRTHVELFGANRVVLLAAGIGTRGPRRIRDGRLLRAACFGALVTLDPTGTVYFRAGLRLTLGNLFRAWGQPLNARRIASFRGTEVRVYVDGRRRRWAPAAVPLVNGEEVVLEVGPRVPPHARFSFPSPPSPRLR